MNRASLSSLAASGLIAAATLLSGPVLAQAVDPNQPQNNGSMAASQTVPPGEVAPGQDPHTATLNAGVGNRIQSANAVNAANQAQYQSDLDAYDTAMRAHNRRVAQQDVRYARQKRAYADAMAAWRMQALACQNGHKAACDAPTPQPSDFY